MQKVPTNLHQISFTDTEGTVLISARYLIARKKPIQLSLLDDTHNAGGVQCPLGFYTHGRQSYSFKLCMALYAIDHPVVI